MIAAPARFHADLILAAAEAGKSVFCEKPAALSQGDLDRANDAVRAVGVVLQVGFDRRFLPEWVAACALIDDGTLGTPRVNLAAQHPDHLGRVMARPGPAGALTKSTSIAATELMAVSTCARNTLTNKIAAAASDTSSQDIPRWDAAPQRLPRRRRAGAS